MEPAPKVLYSRDEAAQALALSVSMLDGMIAQGLVRTARYGRRILIHRDEIERAGRRIAQGDMPDVRWPEKKSERAERMAS